ncbi:MAG: phosphatidylserine/phosphatidylglycerophosphate/cardiolipin synthase family protein [Gemmatimonadales bacterium]
MTGLSPVESPGVESVDQTQTHRAIDRAAAARAIPGNRVTLLQDGPAIYDAMLVMIAGARQFIHFENYIIRSDRTGWRFAEALAARAREGLPVRVLYDWLGSIGTRRSYWRFLREAGCEVRRFNPPALLRPMRLISRDHRKLLVADGCRAIVGGFCIGDEWAGDPSRGLPPWRETAVQIDGPASQALDIAFARVWRFSGAPLPEDERATDVPSAGEAAVRVVVGEPGRQRAYRVLEYLTAGCRQRLWIVDAYLVPPPRLFEVLSLAESDGVDIRLLVPGASDLPLVRHLTRLGYRDMLRAGLRIFEWTGPMIHAKTMVADSLWVRVGTSNINAASLIGNFELDLVVEDAGLALQMEQQFRRDIGASIEVIRESRRLSGALGRVVPSRLARVTSETTAPKRRGARERRERAKMVTRQLATGAFRSMLGPTSLGFVVLGILFVGLPQFMGYVFGGLCLWFALVVGLQAWRRRGAA